MKKLSKYLMTAMLSVMMIFTMGTAVFATTGMTDLNPSVINGSNSNANVTSIINIGNDIYKVLFAFGMAASVIVIVILGLKYMMGSPEDKSDYKKSMMPYLIGAICVFAASAIATVIFRFASGFSAGNN